MAMTFEPALTHPPATVVTGWREQSLAAIGRLTAGIALPVLLLALLDGRSSGSYAELAALSVAIAVAGGGALAQRLAYRVRAYALLSGLAFLGLPHALRAAPGVGLVFTLAAALLAALLLERRAALAAWGLLGAGAALYLALPPGPGPGGALGLALGLLLVAWPAGAVGIPLLSLLGRLAPAPGARPAEPLASYEHSRAVLQGLLDNAPAAIYVKDIAGRYLITNAYMHAVHGLSAEQMRGQDAAALFGAQAEPWHEHERAVLATGMAVAQESVVGGPEQAHSYYEIKFPIRDAAGSIYAVGGIAADITDRKRADEALERHLRLQVAVARFARTLLRAAVPAPERDALLAAVFEEFRIATGLAHIGLYRFFERDGAPYYRSVFQRPDGAVVRDGTPFADLSPAMRERLLRGEVVAGPAAQAFVPGAPNHLMWQRRGLSSLAASLVTVDGEPWGFAAFGGGEPYRPADPEELALLGALAEMVAAFLGRSASDAALQQQRDYDEVLASSLRDREHLIQRIATTSPDIIYVFDLRAQRSVYANRSLGAVLGYDEEFQVLGELVAAGLMPPEDLARLTAARASAIAVADHDVIELEYRLRRSDGAMRWMLSREVIFARDADGQPTQVLGLARDITDQKEGQLELARRETLLREIHDALPGGYLFQKVEGRDGRYIDYTYISDGLETLFGLTYEQVRADPELLSATFVPEDRAFVHEADLEAIRTLTPFHIEARRRTADGRVGWFQLRAVPQPLPDDLVLWNGVCLEITDRKQAELGLARQLRYAEAIASCSHILLVRGGAAPGWAAAVEQAVAVLRTAVGCDWLALNFFPRADELAQPPLCVADYDPARPFTWQAIPPGAMPPGLREQIAAGNLVAGAPEHLFPSGSPVRRSVEASGAESFLILGLQVGGAWRGYMAAGDMRPSWLWDRAALQLLRTGLEMVAAFIHQWETAEALRARETQLRAVGDNLPNGFFFQLRYDDGRTPVFTYISSGVEQLLGITPAMALGDAETLFTLIAPDDRPRMDAAALRSLATMSDLSEVVRHQPPGGQERWIYFSARPRRTPAGDLLCDGMALDITERQRAAEELERARDAAEAAARAKSAFLASMSHEIRTPLNAVIGMAGILQETPLSSDQREVADIIASGGRALLEIINDILDFSRFESGQLNLEDQPFDLHALLAESLTLIEHGASQKGLALRRALDADLPRAIVGDAGRLRQVLLNLLSNAVKFTRSGAITLRAGVAAGGLAISVEDTGVGIAAAQREQIFEPFVQADSSTARQYGGTGLGLAICRQLVTLMGGTITLASSLGAGSRFTVTLPLRLASAAPAPAPPLAALPAIAPRRVLVVEDNPINQQVTRRLLLRMGQSVDVVPDGYAAVAAVAATPYDVVLMDVQMPGLDGEAATRQIRQLGPEVHQPWIVALTANALAGDRERFLEAGMDGYLSKPVDPAALQRALAGAERGPAPAPAAAPLVDWPLLMRLVESFGLAPAEARQVARSIFEREIPPQIAALAAAVGRGDEAATRKEAHRLCGGCLQLGAVALAELCRGLEQPEPGRDAAAIVAAIRDCYAATSAQIHEQLGGAPQP